MNATNVFMIMPIMPYIDGYGNYDCDFFTEVVGVSSMMNDCWFSKSRKTCYANFYHSETDVFRKVGKHWLCWGSGSKQKWEIKKC